MEEESRGFGAEGIEASFSVTYQCPPAGIFSLQPCFGLNFIFRFLNLISVTIPLVKLGTSSFLQKTEISSPLLFKLFKQILLFKYLLSLHSWSEIDTAGYPPLCFETQIIGRVCHLLGSPLRCSQM